MSTLITRLYQTTQQCGDAIALLKDRGFGDADFTVVTAPAGDTSAAAVTAAIVKAGVAADEAAKYVQGVLGGGAVVVVNAPFGTAAKATATLDKFNPVAAAPDVYSAPQFGRISTMSRATPTARLLKNNGFFATSLGLPTIIRGGISRSASSGKPFSKATSGKPFSSVIKSR